MSGDDKGKHQQLVVYSISKKAIWGMLRSRKKKIAFTFLFHFKWLVVVASRFVTWVIEAGSMINSPSCWANLNKDCWTSSDYYYMQYMVWWKWNEWMERACFLVVWRQVSQRVQKRQLHMLKLSSSWQEETQN